MIRIAAVVAVAGALGACATLPGGGRATGEVEALRVQCAERGGVLVPNAGSEQPNPRANWTCQRTDGPLPTR